MYLPTAYWSALQARTAQAAALVRDLDDMTREAAQRKQLSQMLKSKRLAREAEQILREMSAGAAVEDVDRNVGGKP